MTDLGGEKLLHFNCNVTGVTRTNDYVENSDLVTLSDGADGQFVAT